MFNFPSTPEKPKLSYKCGTQILTPASERDFLLWEGAMQEWTRIYEAYLQYLLNEVNNDG